MQGVAVRCSVPQCVAVCCSVPQCVAGVKSREVVRRILGSECVDTLICM